MTLKELLETVENCDCNDISGDTPIHFIDIDCDGNNEPDLIIYTDDADRLIIRNHE